MTSNETLEINKSYQAVDHKNEVKILTSIEHKYAMTHYGPDILKALGEKNLEREEREQKLAQQEVVIGRTNDINMPTGRRHKQTGKCLGLGKGGKADPKLNEYLSRFDIHLQ